MNGREVHKDDEAILREIIRSVDKRLEYSFRDSGETEARTFIVHLTNQNRAADVTLSIEDLKSARSDLVRRNKIRQKIKHSSDYMDLRRFIKDVLGTKAERMLQAADKPEPYQRQPFRGRGRR